MNRRRIFSKVYSRLLILPILFYLGVGTAFAANKKITDEDLMAFLNKGKTKGEVLVDSKPAPQKTEAPKEEIKEEDEKVEQEEVSGKISAINKMGIAVETEHTKSSANEMYLPFGDKVKVNRIQSLGSLKMGDVVTVYYERAYRMDPKKKEKIILKTTATSVDFIKPAPQGLQSPEEGA